MGKRTRRQLLHVRISEWLWVEAERILEDGESILDIAYRGRPSKLGPAGWSLVFAKTVLGETHTHGLFFPVMGRPSKKDVHAAFASVRAEIDKASTRKSLIVTPDEVGPILQGIGGMKNVPRR